MAYIDEVVAVSKMVPIFPCRATTVVKDGKEFRRKRPHITKFRQRSTQNESQIRRWWTRWPDALVGMPTGTKSGKYAIDFDAKNGKTIKRLMSLLPGEIDEDDVTQTSKNGMHVIFEMDPSKVLRNGTNVWADNIDTRGEGGYLIIAPSPHYELSGSLDETLEVPDWVYESLASIASKNREDRPTDGTEVQNAETVIEALNMLDPVDYRSYEDWVRVMLACYHGSNADDVVKAAFKDWSSRDGDAYDSQTDYLIDDQWSSAATDIEGILTFKSLVHEVRKKHGTYVVNPVNPFGDIEPIGGRLDDDEGDGEIKAVQRTPKLETTNRGIRPNLPNLSILLSYPKILGKENELFGLFKYNMLSYKAEFVKDPPWAKGMADANFDDNSAVQMATYIGGKYRGDYSIDNIIKGVEAYAQKNHSYHPIQDYLTYIEWDGVERLDTWLIDYAGVNDDEYARLVGRKFMISAVARAMKPGCKVDTMLVLEGAQGLYKSSLIEALGGDWYRSPGVRNLASKEAVLGCLGAWICEMDEMESVKQSSIGTIKKFITTRKDTVRFVYDRTYTDIDRGFVFVGTINPSGNNQYVHDVTGARRFWPVRCLSKVKMAEFKDVRDQLFAEALVAYNNKEHWWLTEHEEKIATAEQEKRISDHAWEEPIREYLYYGHGKMFPTITPGEIYADILEGRGRLSSATDANHIARIMVDGLGWQVRKSRLQSNGKNGASARRYIRPDELADIE